MQEKSHRSHPHRSITEIVAPSNDESLVKELEEHRVAHQLLTGEFVDLSRQYSSQLPPDVQRYLLSQYELLYFDNLPGYVRDFYFKRLKDLAKDGRLDEVEDSLLAGYLKMRKGCAAAE